MLHLRAFEMNSFLTRLRSSIAVAAAGPNTHNLLIDGFARVISFDGDRDPRLQHCNISTLSGDSSQSVPCSDLTPTTHPVAIVRNVFERFQNVILARPTGNNSPRQQVFAFNGSDTYLLVAQDATEDPYSRLIIIFLIPDTDLVASRRQLTWTIVLACSVVLVVAALVTVGVGFGVFRHANEAVEQAACLAVCIADYDTNAAESIIQKEKSAANHTLCGSPAGSLLDHFETIVTNLRMYQPFLPSCLLLDGRRGDDHDVGAFGSIGASVTNHATLQSEVADELATNLKKCNTKFKPVAGSFIVVDLGNLPISTNPVVAGGLCPYSRFAGTFLRDCIAVIEQGGGVIHNIGANRIIAAFNCWNVVEDHEVVACRCALGLREFLSGRAKFPAVLNIAIAVTSGECIAGTGGDHTLKSRVLAGFPIDLAVRLAPLQRLLSVPVVTIDATVAALKKHRVCCAVPVDIIAPIWLQAGRPSCVKCFELLPPVQSLHPLVKLRTNAFRSLYERGDVREMNTILKKITQELTYGKQMFPEARLTALGAEVSRRAIRQPQTFLGMSLHPDHQPPTSMVRSEWGWEYLEGKELFEEHHRELLLLASSVGVDQRWVSRSMWHMSPKTEPRKGDGKSISTPLWGTNDAFDDSMRSSAKTHRDRGVSSSLVTAVDNLSSTSLLHNSDVLGSLKCVESTTDTNDVDVKFCSRHSIEDVLMMSATGNGTTHSGQLIDASSERFFPTGKVIGPSMMGTNYLAFHETGTMLTLKYYQPSTNRGVKALVNNWEMVRMFNHPNINAVVSSVVIGSSVCIFTEYLPMGTLLDFIAYAQYPTPNGGVDSLVWRDFLLSKFVMGIAMGVDYMHSQKPAFVHGGVSPGTIALSSQGAPKLTDCGIACLASNDGSGNSALKSVPWYVAPELSDEGAQPTTASDVYSMGVTILHLLQGVPIAEMLQADDSGRKPHVQEWLGPELCGLLTTMINRDPHHRRPLGQLSPRWSSSMIM